MIQVALLAAGIVSMFWRPRGIAMGMGPAVAAAVLLVTGGIRWHAVTTTATALRNPLLFLVFAVPLAVLLDHVGFFTAIAAKVDGHGGLHGKLWLLAAAVVILFNLDAAVVLLTPLYIRVARRNGLDPLVVGIQPALLACLASGVLPVSNLTNLLAAQALHLDASEFLAHLALPSLVATGVGWLAYRRLVVRPATGAAEAVALEDHDPRAVARGAPVVAFVLLGFTVGDELGVAAWVVAGIAVLALALMTRRVPWRSVPYQAILLTFALGLLVAGAVPHLGLHRVFAGTGTLGGLRAFGFGALASVGSNNLPAALAGLGSLAHRSQVWPLLVGLNMAPLLVLTGSLSSLLWRDTAKRLDVTLTPARFTAIGARVVLPAIAAALAVALLLA